MGLSDILLNDHSSMSKEILKEHLELLNNSINSQYRLLEDLLNWSRIQSGKMKCMPRKLNILDTVNLAIANLLQNAKSKNIEIILEINKYLTVYADQDMFLLLVRNLFSNAIKFTNPGGKIKILTGNLNNDLFIEIRDNGIGIEKENMDKLFRLDVSFSMTGTSNENGSGLGLLLCKEIIDRHNGKIWVESEIGKGSSFKFIFPKE
jgi:signal transduction histidine kinase